LKEVFASTVGEFCYMTDNTYTPEEMRQQESLMLQVRIIITIWLLSYYYY